MVRTTQDPGIIPCCEQRVKPFVCIARLRDTVFYVLILFKTVDMGEAKIESKLSHHRASTTTNWDANEQTRPSLGPGGTFLNQAEVKQQIKLPVHLHGKVLKCL